MGAQSRRSMRVRVHVHGARAQVSRACASVRVLNSHAWVDAAASCCGSSSERMSLSLSVVGSLCTTGGGSRTAKHRCAHRNARTSGDGDLFSRQARLVLDHTRQQPSRFQLLQVTEPAFHSTVERMTARCRCKCFEMCASVGGRACRRAREGERVRKPQVRKHGDPQARADPRRGAPAERAPLRSEVVRKGGPRRSAERATSSPLDVGAWNTCGASNKPRRGQR
eukprot:4873983-Pleurochrysis_carterae.AAC.1